MNPKQGTGPGGLPFSPLSWCCIAATRQGSPDGALRAALTGPGRDAEDPSFLRGENGRLQMEATVTIRPPHNHTRRCRILTYSTPKMVLTLGATFDNARFQKRT